MSGPGRPVGATRATRHTTFSDTPHTSGGVLGTVSATKSLDEVQPHVLSYKGQRAKDAFEVGPSAGEEVVVSLNARFWLVILQGRELATVLPG